MAHCLRTNTYTTGYEDRWFCVVGCRNPAHKEALVAKSKPDAKAHFTIKGDFDPADLTQVIETLTEARENLRGIGSAEVEIELPATTLTL